MVKGCKVLSGQLHRCVLTWQRFENAPFQAILKNMGDPV